MKIFTQQKTKISSQTTACATGCKNTVQKLRRTGVRLACILTFLLAGVNLGYAVDFSATLSVNQKFTRPNQGPVLCGNSSYGVFTSTSGGGTLYSYATQAFTVSTAGNYLINVTSSTASDPMLFVYTGSFTASSPLTNFKVGDDDATGSLLSKIDCQNYFDVGTYVIVVTSYSSSTTSGTVNFSVTGGGTIVVLPSVTTSAASGIGSISATLNGNCSADGGAGVTARGVGYSTSQNPTAGSSVGAGTGSISQSATGLTPGTLYYARAWATNSVGTAYGAQVSFTTLSTVAPTVSTTAITAITTTTATSGGNVTSDGGASVSARGIVYSTSPSPTLSNSVVASGSGTGAYASNLTGLSQSTRYYVRAFATNTSGTSYGTELSFVTNHIVTYVAGTNGSSIAGTNPQSIANGSGGSAVTAVPNPNYSFLNWSDGSTVNPRTESNVTGSKTVTANFILNKLSFFTQPSNTIAGANIPFTMHIVDAYGNLMTNSDGNTITVAISTNAGGGTLAGTLTLTPSGGVASSSIVWINKTGNGYKLSATASPLTSSISTVFNITPAAIDHFTVLGITTPVMAGVFTSPVVTAYDQYDNIRTNHLGTIVFSTTNVSLKTGAPTVLPSNYTFLAGDNGVKTFTNGVNLKQTGTGYTVTVTGDTKTGVQSAVEVTPAALDHFHLAANGTITAGTAFNVTATAHDLYENVKTDYTGLNSVNWTTTAISSLNGTARIIPSNGNQTFTEGISTVSGFTFFNSNQSLLTPFTSPTITITDALTAKPGTTDPITVNHAPLYNFKVVAGTAQTAGTSFSTTVTARDVYWNTATTYEGSIRFKSSDDALVTFPPGLQSFAPASTNHGVVTYTNGITINKIGAYWLRAADSEFAYKSGEQQNIVVVPGAFSPANSTVTIDNLNKIAGESVVVTLTPRDVNNNLLYSCQNITTYLDAVLAGTETTNGSATGADGVYTFNVPVTSTTAVNLITAKLGSDPFTQIFDITITPAPPSLTHSTIVPDGATITTDGTQVVTVQLKDQFNNLRTTNDGTVTLTTNLAGFTDNTGSHKTVTAVYGNGNYTLTLYPSTDGTNGTGSATISGSVVFNASPGGPGVWSGDPWPSNGALTDHATVTITEGLPSLTTSDITANPTSITTDGTSNITVQLRDQLGNLIVNNRGTVSLISSLGLVSSVTYDTNGLYRATLTGDIRGTRGTGTATITGSFAGSGTASSVSGAFADVDTTVGITEGQPDLTDIQITTAVGTITADGNTLVTVQLRDQFGNLIVNNLGAVTLSTNLGVIDNGTTTGATDITANYTTGGQYTATFKMNGIGVGNASITGKYNTAAISDNASVLVTHGAATQLTIATAPAQAYQAIAGVSFNAQPVIHVKDQWGNLVTTGANSTAAVTATRVTGSMLLQGTTTVNAVGGIATFSGLNYRKAELMNIQFTSGALTAPTSTDITVVHNVPAYMVITGAATQTAGVPQTITINVFDAYNNPANRFAGDKSLTFNGASVSPTPPFNPTVSGTNFGATTTISFNAGAATASMILYTEEIAHIGANFTNGSYSDTYTGTTAVNINAADGTPDNRLTVDVHQTVPAYLAITGTGSQVAGTAQTITIKAYDGFNNLATNYTGTKTIRFGGASASLAPVTNPTTDAINFGSDVLVSFVNGIATASIALYKVEAAVITATDQATSGITTTTGYTLAVNVTHAVPNYYAVTSTGTQTAGTSQTITVTAYDAYNNVATTYAGSKSVIFSGANPSPAPSTNPTMATIAFGTTTSLTFTNGVATGSMSLYRMETAHIIATSGSITTPVITGYDYRLAVVVDHTTPNYLALTGTSTQTAGSSQTITVTAYDIYNNVAVGYTGAHALTFSGANNSPAPASSPTVAGTVFGSVTSLTFTSGVATGSMILYKVETALVTATDGTINADSHKLSVAVSHATPNYLTITGSGAQVAGVSQNVTITAYDAYNNIATGYAGSKSLTFSGANPSPSNSSPSNLPNPAMNPVVSAVAFGTPTSLTFASGTVTTAMNLYKVETALLTATDATISADSHKLSVAVSQSAPAYLGITGAATQTAATSQTITITAYDSFNNLATAYTGDHTLTFTGAIPSLAAPVGNNMPTPTTPVTNPSVGGTAFNSTKVLTFTNGVATSGMLLYKTETALVTATDGGINSTDHKLSVLVNPTLLYGFIVAGVGNPHDFGTTQTPVVTAYDTYNNVKTNYVGTVTFSNTDISATNPADYKFTLLDAGVHSFLNGVRFGVPGKWWLTALDLAEPQKYGAQADIYVQRAVTITANAHTKTYGDLMTLGAMSISECTVTGIVTGIDPVVGEITGIALSSTGTPVTATVSGSPYAISTSLATGPYNAAYYRIVYSNSGQLTVTRRTLTLSNFLADPKNYDGTTSVSGTGFSDNRVNSDVLTFDNTAAFASKNVASPQTVNYTGITISGGAGAGNYTLASTTGTATANILVRPINVTAQTDTKNYDGGTSSTVMPFVGALQTGDILTSAGVETFDTRNAGSSKVLTPSGTVINDGNSGNNYAISYLTNNTGIISQRNISGTFTADNKVYNGNNTATIVGYGLVGVLLADVSNVTLTGGTATFSDKNVDNGKTVTSSGMTITGSEAANYHLTAVGTTTADITPMPVTVTAVTVTKTYDGGISSSGSPTVGTFATGDFVNVSPTQVYDNKNQGDTHVLTASGLTIKDGSNANMTGNYTITYDPSPASGVINKMAVNVTAITATKTYDGGVTSSGSPIVGTLAAPDVVNVSPTQVYDNKNQGNTHVLTASGLTIKDGVSADMTDNYTITYNPSPATGVINKMDVTVTAVTATKTYDGLLTSSGSPTVGTLITGDVVNAAPTQVYDNKNVASNHVMTASGLTIKDALAADMTGNYNIIYAHSATPGIINQANVTVTAVTATKTYDGLLTSSGSPTVGALIAGDVVNAAPTQVYDNRNYGTSHILTASGLTINDGLSANMTGNYNITYNPSPATGVINKIGVTVTAVTAIKTYDGNIISAGVPTVGSLASGDAVNVAPTQVYDNRDYGTTHILTASGLTIKYGVIDVTGNYTITYSPSPATGVINKMGVTVNAVTDTKIYDGNINSAGVPTVGTLALGDVVNAAPTQTYDIKDAGTSHVMTASGLTLKDGSNVNVTGNYTISYFTNTTGIITPLAITGNFTVDATKVYNGNTIANIVTRTLNGSISGDDVSLTGGTANYNSKNIGTAKTVTLTGMGLSGAQAGNYSLTSVATVTANITVRTLTLYNFGADSKAYDGTTIATGTGFNDDRVLDDNLSFGRNAAFDTPLIGVGKPVYYTSIVISGGTDRNNYVLASTIGTAHADITARDLTITADNKTKTYGTAINGGSGSSAFVSAGLQNSETIGSVTIAYGTGSAATAGASTYSGAVTPSLATGGTFNAGNYAISYVNGNIIVDPKALTAASTVASKVFNGSAATGTVTLGVVTGLVGTETLVITPAATNYADANVETSKSTTISYALANGTNGGLAANYSMADLAATGDITAKEIVVTPSAGQNKVYGQVDPAYTYTFAPALVGSDLITGSMGRAAGENVNIYAFSIGTLTAGTNYNLSVAATPTFSITRKALTATSTVANRPYNADATAGTITLGTVTGLVGTETLEITPMASNYAIANVGTGKTTTISYVLADGTNGGLAANYSMANLVTTGEITGKEIVITAYAGQSKVYGQVDPTFTYTFTPALEGSDVITGSLGRATGENVNTYAFAIGSLTAGSNYILSVATMPTFSITKKALTATSTVASRVYNGLANAGTVTIGIITGLVGTETLAITPTAIDYANANVANGKATTISYALADGTLGGLAANYSMANLPATGDITAKEIVVTANVSQSKVYGQVDPTFTFTFAPALEGPDVITGSMGRDAGENVNTYAFVIGTLTAGSNYSLSVAATPTFSISTKELSINGITGAAKPYDGNTTASFTGTASLSGLETGDILNVSLGGTPSAEFLTATVGNGKTINVGGYTLSGSASDNYMLTQPVVTGNITAKALTVTGAVVTTKIYDGNTNATISGATLEGIIGSEDVVLGNAAIGTFDNPNIGAGISVTTAMTISGAAMDNYTLTQPVLLGNITAKELTVTGSIVTFKIYDGNNTAVITGATLSGKVTGDDVTLGNTGTGLFDNANVGTGKTVTAAMTIAGMNAGNYTLTQPVLTGNITAKELTVTGSIVTSKTYDGNSTAVITGATLSGSIDGDNVTLGNTGTGIFDNANVGTGKAVTSAMTIVGENAGNYTLTQPTLTGTISAATLTVTGASVTSKVYDGNTVATITGAALSGVVTEDVVTLGNSGAGTFADANAGTGKTVTSAMTISGANAGNYTLTQPALTGTIMARPITISVDAGQTKVYGSIDVMPYTYQITSGSIVAGDLPTGAMSRAAGENVGNYAIGKNTLTYGTNYNESYVGASFTITQLQVIVTAVAGQTRLYGEADPATFNYTFAPSLVGTDAISGILGRVSGENAGNYAYTIGSLTAGPNYSLTVAATPEFSILPKPIVFAAVAGHTKVYGEADPAPYTYTVSPALISGDAITGTMGRTSGEDVGNYAFTPGSLTAGSNYSLSVTAAPEFIITPKPIVIMADAGQTKVYGEADPVLFTYTFAPALIGADVISGTMGRATGENAGNYAYTPGSLTVGSNYSLSVAAAPEFSITPKPIVITAVEGQTKVYGEADPASFTYTVAPAMVGNDAISGVMGRAAGENSGSYAYTPGSLTAGPNYSLSVAEVHAFSIMPKPIVITGVAGQTKVYGTADPVLFTYTVAPSLIGTDVISGTMGRISGENAGNYAYTTGSLTAGLNYTLSAAATTNFSISAKGLTIAAGNKVKCYDGAAYSSGNDVTYSGFVNGENSTVLSGALSFGGTAIDAIDPGSYTIIPGGLTSGNYDITFQNGTLTINAAPAPTISGLGSVCAGTAGVIYTTEAEMSGYVWVVSEGGSITSGAGTNTVTLTWSVAGTQTVSVNYANANNCTASSATSKSITVYALTGNAGSIAGTTTVCYGSRDVAYSVPVIADAATYVWTLPAGATIASGSGTRSITVDYSTTSSGNISVYGSSPCGNGTASSLAVTLSLQPGVAGAITGESTFVPGSNGLIFSVNPIANATGYHWTLPSGATIVSGANTNTISVNFGSTATAGNITVYGLNACGNGEASPDFAVIIPEVHFDVFPVPSDGLFTTSITSPTEAIFTLRIFSYTGHLILEMTGLRTTNGVLEKVIDLRPIPSGIYYVEFSNSNFKEVRKVLVNRK